MGIELAQAYVTVRAETASVHQDITKGIAPIQQALSSLGGGVSKLLGGIGIGFAASQLVNMFREASAAAEQAILAVERMEIMMSVAAERVGFSIRQLNGWIDELAKHSVEGGSELAKAATNLMKFDISGDMFRRTMQAATDLATIFGSVEGAASMLGRALQYPAHASRALRQAGIDLTDQEKLQLKAFTESKQEYLAQELILGKFEEKYRGMADRFRKTPMGQLLASRNQAQDLQEAMARMMIPLNTFFVKLKVEFMQAVVAVAQALQPLVNGFIAFNDQLGGMPARIVLIVAGVTALSAALKLFHSHIGLVLSAMKALWFNPFTIWIVLIGSVVVGIIALVDWLMQTTAVSKVWEGVLDNLYVAWIAIKNAFTVVWDALKSGLTQLVIWLSQITGINIPSLGDTMAEVFAGMLVVVSNWVMSVSEWIQVIAENFKVVWDNIGLGLLVAVSYMTDIWWNFYTKFLPQSGGYMVYLVVEIFKKLVKTVTELIWNMVLWIGDALAKLPGLIWDAITGADIEKAVAEGVKKAKTAVDSFGKGLNGEMPTFTDLFAPSDTTNKLKQQFGDAMKPLFEAKKKLEEQRPEIVAQRKPKVAKEEPPEKKVKEFAYNFYELTGKRLGFADLGKQIQDIMLKQGQGGDPQLERMIGLQDVGVKIQDKQLKQLEDISAKSGAGMLK